MPFPHYDDFHALVEGGRATGDCAYRVSPTNDSDDENDSTTPTEDLKDTGSSTVPSQLTDTASQVSYTAYGFASCLF